MSGNRIDSRELFAAEREIIIAHGDENYRLRLTSQNKLDPHQVNRPDDPVARSQSLMLAVLRRSSAGAAAAARRHRA